MLGDSVVCDASRYFGEDDLSCSVFLSEFLYLDALSFEGGESFQEVCVLWCVGGQYDVSCPCGRESCLE